MATSVFIMLLGILVAITDSTLRSLRGARSQAEAFQSAREALDLISRRLSQATLNTYLAYDSPSSPTRYLRRSVLRFVIGPAAGFLGAGTGPGSAVFFQAPLGRATNNSNRQLNELLNTCGFFIRRGADAERPGIVPGAARSRYRLMELQTTSQDMSVYAASNHPATYGDWFTAPAAGNYSRLVAENIVLLVLRPMKAGATPGVREDLSTDYTYNSVLNASNNPQPATAHQLPPFIDVTLVAVDEAGFARQGEPALDFSDLFLDVTKYDTNMDAVAKRLQDAKLEYRDFRTSIALPNSKWSE